MPSNGELNTLLPVSKGKVDLLQRGSYQGIKWLEHGMKVLEKGLEERLRDRVTTNNMQMRFMPKKVLMQIL